MRHIRFIAAGGFMLFFAACAPGPAVKSPAGASRGGAAPKSRVGVMELYDKSGYGRLPLGGIAADILTEELEKSGKFVVVERAKIRKLLEDKLAPGQASAQGPAAALLGKKMGLDALVTGVVARLMIKPEGTGAGGRKAEASLEISLLDVQSGRVLLTETRAGSSSVPAAAAAGEPARGDNSETPERAGLRACSIQFVDLIAAKLRKKAWSCVIVSVAGSQIYLNAGQNSGLAAGSKLDCYRNNGSMQEYLGSAEVERYCGDGGNCSVAGFSGAGAQAGDTCSLSKQ